jgi:uncharacterized protein
MLRLIFFVLLIFVLDWYVYQPFQSSIQPLPRWARQTMQVLYWSVPVTAAVVLILFQLGYAHWLPGPPGRPLIGALLFLAYICKIAVVPFVALDDISRGVRYVARRWQDTAPYLPGRSLFLSTLGLSAGLLPFVSLLYGMWRNPYRYKVHRLAVPIAGLPAELEGLRIVQISDIHSGSFTFPEPVENAIRLINEQSPDLVLFTGDLVNSKSEEMRPFIPMFSGIRSRYGVFSVLGNHDYGDYHQWPDQASKKANFQAMLDIHRELGWDLLRNEHRILELGSARLAIVGVENYSAHPRFHRYGDLAKALAGSEDAQVRVLLSHDPSHWEAQVLDSPAPVDLTLSGHTHGMQFGIEIPGWFRWSPIQYMYRQWAGLYTRGQQHLYVNRGLGFLGYPGRVGILPEITLLELRGTV